MMDGYLKLLPWMDWLYYGLEKPKIFLSSSIDRKVLMIPWYMKKIVKKLKGLRMEAKIITPTVTIFDNNGNIDIEGNKLLIKHLIDNGVK